METSAAKDKNAALQKFIKPLPTSLSNFETIGAICESSPWLARRMLRAIGSEIRPILELGAGFGSITSVLPKDAVSLEREIIRYNYLKESFPDRQILEDCALAYLSNLATPTVVVSCIPSVNNSEFRNLRSCVSLAYKAGLIPKLITYTYFLHNPFANVFEKSEVVGIEIFNFPPAFVWRYS